MDPITATTTLITLATFIKDLIEVGQSIKESIEKVSENRRQIRELTNDVLRSLADLANITRGNEDAYQAPALLGALGDLKADMLHVLQTCRKISPAERSPGFRSFGSQFKVWMKRNEVEAKIRRLKEHVINCYIKFTAFSTARNEQRTARIDETTAHIEDMSLETVNTTLRVEQTFVVSHTENQVRLRRLEGMVAQVLVETPFGQKIAERTMEIILSDPTRKSVESQYLSEQAMRLLQSLQYLMKGGHIVVDSDNVVDFFPMRAQIFVQPGELSHVVHQVLGMVLKIQNSYTGLKVEHLQYLMGSLGAYLDYVGMKSEAIAWEVLAIQVLEHVAGCGQSAIVLPQLVHSRRKLSGYYRHQLRYELALQTSQQALDIWQSLHLQHYSDPHRQCLSTSILVTHSRNLQESGQQEFAIIIAQKAVAACRPMVEQTIESASQISPITPEMEYNAVISAEAFFILAKSLSSVDRHIEAYEASKEGFQLVLRFSGSIRPPAGEFIDSFIDHICKVMEEDTFSSSKLADNVILFRDLAHHYPKEFSSQFLRLLYAYVYTSGQNSPPVSMKELRIILEPDSNSPLPVLHTSSNSTTHLDDFNPYGGVLKDVLQASHVGPWGTWKIHIPLIKNIFINHFDQATANIQEVVSNLIADTSQSQRRLIWVLDALLTDVVPVVHWSNQVVISRISLEIIGHLQQTPSTLHIRWYPAVLSRISWSLQLAGLLDGALATVDEAIERRRLSFNSDNVDEVDELRWSHIRRASILLDMARVSEAVEAAREANTLSLLPVKELDRKFLCMFQTKILRRTARNREAQQVLENFISDRGHKNQITEETFNPLSHFLLTELAAIREVGYVGQAVHDAEQAVLACQNSVHNTDAEKQKGALVQTLTTLSNRLAADGRHEDALVAAEEATSIYSSDASRMWGAFLNTTRKQELGGNTFHSLSLRLTTSGRLVEALANAEKATELYRELVLLAPVHHPALATSLRNQAAILWKTGGPVKSIAACEEAVNILRKVSDNETYFLGALGETLDQLAGYLVENEEVDRVSAAVVESAEVRRRIESLPPPPPFMFIEVKTQPLEDGEKDGDEAWETATESDDEYHDVLDAGSAAGCEAPTALNDNGQLQPACANLQLIASAGPQSEAIAGATLAAEATTLQLSPQAENEAARNAQPGTSHLPDILATPLEVQLKVKLSSTPMDILWWILVAILGLAVGVLWNRV
ncbi:hypothetical protein B0H11DRAFT_641918 [Mycena galericulata]|nr:hypothetical protein B0H11DRAFT_641918 [Mycena galericulata]